MKMRNAVSLKPNPSGGTSANIPTMVSSRSTLSRPPVVPVDRAQLLGQAGVHGLARVVERRIGFSAGARRKRLYRGTPRSRSRRMSIVARSTISPSGASQFAEEVRVVVERDGAGIGDAERVEEVAYGPSSCSEDGATGR